MLNVNNLLAVIPKLPQVDYLDPMSIIGERTPISDAAINDMEKYFPVTDLYAIIQTGIMLLSVITVLMSLIVMLFINSQEKLAGKKADIMHKLAIVFAVSSLITLLNGLTMLLDGIFY